MAARRPPRPGVPAPDGVVVVALDDALTGRLPAVCVRTGERADGYAPLRVSKPFGLWWLLLALGPVGVVLLVAMVPRLRVTYLVRLPMTREAFGRIHVLWVQRFWGAVLGAAAIGMTPLLLLWYPPVAFVVGATGLVAVALAARAHVVAPWAQPSVMVDRAGSEATLLGVHQRFVLAAEGTWSGR
jgi:hypothetical protein